MQRVAAIKGTNRPLIVVPHGYDDPNTAFIGEEMASQLNCSAVINYGWKRADAYDYWKDQADCNKISHVKEDVIDDEFYVPLYTFLKQTRAMFIIHGVSSSIRSKAKGLDLILGWGEGSKPRHSTREQDVKTFALLTNQQGFKTYLGKAGGKYAGWGSDNLNQLPNQLGGVKQYGHSIQIEIVRERRIDEATARKTGVLLAKAIHTLFAGPSNLYTGQTIPEI